MAVSLLAIINALLPKDRESAKIAADVAYGPGARHRLDIYAPAGSGPWPVVFFIYGGSWSDGSRHNYTFAGRAIAAQGFVTVIADYRLVPEVEYPAFLQDCADAFAWTAHNIAGYGGDGDRMALMGHSAGAYNAVMLALDPAYLKARGVLERVKAVVGLSGPYDFLPFDGPISLRVFGAVRMPRTTQPINLVSAEVPPMWLANGTEDTLVGPLNAKALARRLRQAGVEVGETYYPKIGHAHLVMALARPLRAMAPVLAQSTAFLAARLGQ
ncbi:alpha/beta hydrolase [uncultured Devosia sp.]|uniref:alpha/beta hydrolase n=1 Tax=uncultured Devosia sp. TaxID=211434 RepID=UPI0035CB51B8